MAKLGVLHASIVVDGGTRLHFGPQDAVTGKIVLEYKPRTSLFKSTAGTADLFAPLKLEATLRGKTKIIVKQERDAPADHGCLLFLQPFAVFDGTFKAQVGDTQEFPFRITFPSTVGGEMIPPTFSCYFAEFPDTVDIKVVYRIGVKLELPGIDVKVTFPEHDDQPAVEYDVPRSYQTDLNARATSTIYKTPTQSQGSSPGAQPFSKVQQKVKAVFATLPTAAIDISCTKPDYIYPGCNPHFSITVRGENLSETSLVSFRADLIAYTWCKTDKRLKGPFERRDRRTLQKLACQTPLPLQFSKANDYTAALDVDAVFGWTSSFKHSQVARQYDLRIKIKLKVARESVSVDQEFDVIMVPPIEKSMDDTADALPTYESAKDMASSLPPKYG